MPPASDGLVSMAGHNHARQGPGEISLEVSQDNVIVVAGGEEIVGTGGEPHTPHITGVNLELLNWSPTSDIMQDHAGIFVSSHQQSAWGVDTTRGHRWSSGGLVSEGHNVDAAPGPQIPEPHCLVLGARHEHGAPPGVEREDVASVASHGLEGSHSVAVGDVNLAVPGPGWQEEGPSTSPTFLHKAAISHRPIVHTQVVLIPLQGGRAGIEVHQLDSFIIAASGNEVSSRTPGKAVDGAFVVLGSLE